MLANCDALKLLERMPSSSAALVYIDPPWLTAEENGEDTLTKSKLLSLYLYTASHAKEILSESGLVVWHVWPGIAASVRNTLDRVFGEDLFVTEIVLKRRMVHASRGHPLPSHTSLIVYSKSNTFSYKAPTTEHTDGDAVRFRHVDSDGRRYQLERVTNQARRMLTAARWIAARKLRAVLS